MRLVRDDQNAERSYGTIQHDGEDTTIVCQTLELPWRDNAHDVSCIPAGTYAVKLQFSPKHDRMLYHLQDVSGRGDVEIHIGNTVKDTLGCILLGESRGALDGVDAVLASHEAFDAFMALMNGADFDLTVSNP